MKNRLRIALVVLLAAMLACSTGEIMDPDKDPLLPNQSYENNEIVSVQVIPPSGSGSFTLKVDYQTYYAEYSDEKNPGFIYCNYVAPDTVVMGIGVITPPPAPKGVSGKWIDHKAELSFSVVQPNGVVQSGTYLAGCETSWGSRPPVTANFTVVAAEQTPTATQPGAAPAPTLTLTPTITLTGGTITYDEASEQLSPHKDEFGYFPSEHHKWCNPSLTIAPDGAISGDCYSAEDPGDLGLHGTWFGGATIEGKVTGKAVPGGSFTFREELNEKWVYSESGAWSTRTVIIEGMGTFVSATKATGTATLSAECNAWWDGASKCGLYSAYDSFTGTINWEFNGTGATSDADSVSSLSSQIKGGMMPIRDTPAMLPMRGLVSDMLKKYPDLIFKV